MKGEDERESSILWMTGALLVAQRDARNQRHNQSLESQACFFMRPDAHQESPWLHAVCYPDAVPAKRDATQMLSQPSVMLHPDAMAVLLHET